MTDEQLVTIAEITQETFATVEVLSSSFNPAQEASIVSDIATWNDIRNDVDVQLVAGTGGGADYKVQRLLDDIRSRTRKALALTLYSSEIDGGPGSLAIEHRAVF